MLWVDHGNYFGPDRRQAPGGLRLLERRRANCAGPPPPLGTALRQLRMRVIDAQGPEADYFIAYAHGVAQLAEALDERETAMALLRLTALAERGLQLRRDPRPALYEALEQVEQTLRTLH